MTFKLSRQLLFILAAGLFFSGCSTSHFPWVYRIDVDQGNIVDKKKLDQLEIGMTTRQVRYLLGTPIVKDTFHPNRWDYVYTFESGKGVITRKVLTLYFDETLKLQRIDQKPTKTLKRKFF
ncbi:MAG: outer membrane protein assembly factor BamE [Cellvibrionales bacterium]|nr:outer membrane protein assembly factor BamE [Cellvibrionales bacterium]